LILRVVTRVLFAASIVVACWNTAAQAATIEHYSVGDNGAGNGNFQSIFEGASADGTKVFFRTDEALTSADTDTFPDIYERVLVPAGSCGCYG